MIAAVSCSLAAWEVVASVTHRRKVSDLSHTWPWSLLVWGWMGWLTAHFVLEARRAR